MKSILQKFDGDFKTHLNNSSLPAIIKVGGSVLKTYKDALRLIALPKTHNARIVVVSAPGGVSKKIQNLFLFPKKLQSFSSKTEEELEGIYKIYQSIFKDSGLNVRPYWSERLQLFREVVSGTNFEDSYDLWKLQCCALAHLGEVFTVEMLVKLAEQEGTSFSILETQKTIFLQEDFPPLPEDKFAPVAIDFEKSFNGVKSILASNYETSTPLIAPGFVAKNGLLGWNGSDTTAALLGCFYYEATQEFPRIIFLKDRPFQTSGGQQCVNIEGVTKYSFMKGEQAEYEQPFIHPQAIDILDESYSIPFMVEVPDKDSSRLMVTSCSKLAQSAGAQDYPAEKKSLG